MKVYHSLEEFHPLKFAVVTSGTFDGVHKGHQKILARLKEIAADCNGETVVITFWPHPRKILHNPNQNEIKLLSTLEEKTELLKEHGIDHLLIIPFTKEFSQMTSEQFIKSVLSEKINTKKLIIGYDHKFGKNREGSFEHLKNNGPVYGFAVEEIPKQDIDHVAISSTNIRNALLEGKITTATEYLGRYYSFSGKVVEGNKLGRKIGYPTANLQLPSEEKIVPKDGVYAVLVRFKGHLLKGMMNIGYRPTVNGTKRTVEVHIFDFNEVIYGQDLEVLVVEYLRDEQKFSGIEELIKHLHKDREHSIEILKDIE